MKIVTKHHSKEEMIKLLDPTIAKWFTSRFQDFTEPQSYAIPLIHDRKNVLVSSPTGSGKTLTAFLSIINELFKYSQEGKLEDRVYAIYVSPLKALANDINRNLNEPLAGMQEVAAAEGLEFPDIRVGVRTGDTSQAERQRMVRKPPHILITTPESLALVLAAPKFRESFAQVEYVILDEIHEVCDSKRGVFLSLTLERLQAFCNHPITRIGLSATLAPIEDVAHYLVGYEEGKPREVNVVEIMRQRDLDIRVLCPTDDMTSLPFEIVNSKMYDQLYEMILEHRTTIVFTNTRSGTEAVVFKLKERGLEDVEAHHGSLAKETRLDVEDRLKRGALKCVVSSTSLELGIDIGSVDLVVQIGSPKSVAKGLQRIGRAGHATGLTSKGRMLVFEKDDLVECAVLSRAAHKKRIDRVSIAENALDVLSQSLVGMSLEKRWDIQDALNVVRSSYCYRNLDEKSFLEVLRYLGSKDAFEGVYPKIWYDEEEERFGRRGSSRMIYFLNIGTIPEEANYKVFTDKGGLLGDLSEKFVERLSSKDVFVLGGRSYEYIRTKGTRVFVCEADGRKPTVPSWSGEMLPRSFDLSMDVAIFRREMRERLEREDSEDDILSWLATFGIDQGSSRSILSYFREQQGSCDFIPTDRELAVEGYIDMSENFNIVFHFPFGRRVNDALSRAYAFVLTQQYGCNLSVSVTDDTFMITSPKRIELDGVEKVLTSSMLEPVLMRAVKDSELFKQRFRHTASRSFMILRNYRGREVSVGRQQVRSQYLLDALGNMEGVPIIDETYREIMEDVMDIKNAKDILKNIEEGSTIVRPIDYSSTPSPFAHNAVLTGISDMVLMEDRGALLRELHRKVLSKVMGADISEFEFTEDQVVPFFRRRIGMAASKEELLSLIRRAGPLRILKERGRSVYPYTLIDRESIDQWCIELLEEERIASVYIDDAYFVSAEDLDTYLTVMARSRDLNDIEASALTLLERKHTAAKLASELNVPLSTVHQALRRLEATGYIGRVGYHNGKWVYHARTFHEKSHGDAMDEVLTRYLECYAPATVEETAFSLGLAEGEVRQALNDLAQEKLVTKGRFLVSEHEQYMLARDHLRLRTNDLKAYDHRTVESYRRQKQDGPFDNIDQMFDVIGSVGTPLDVFYRVKDFKLSDWEDMRRSGQVLLGRFMRGRVRYVRDKDAPDLVALYRDDSLSPLDHKVLETIKSSEEGMTMRQLSSDMNIPRDRLKDSVDRLDRNMHLVRRFEDGEEWSSENVYIAYDAKAVDSPMERVITRHLRAHSPASSYSISQALRLPVKDIENILEGMDVETISVGPSREEMYLFRDELSLLDKSRPLNEGMQIVSLSDPGAQSMWASIAARYGDRWIYPIVADGRLVGGVEKWNMSGCIEIRELDLMDPSLLSQALDALDVFMQYHNMMGYEIVRLREILGYQPADLPEEHAEVLRHHGYVCMGDMYVKGNMIIERHSWDAVFSYMLHKQRIDASNQYSNLSAAIAAMGGLRSDAEAALRCKIRIPLKKMLEMGFVVKAKPIPDYVTYVNLDYAALCRKAKGRKITVEMDTLLRMIREERPRTRQQIFDRSPLGHRATQEAMKELNDGTFICTDRNRRIHPVPDIDLTIYEARKEVIRHLFRNMGIFTAENLQRYMRYGMPMKELRSILAELEEENFLVKGFLLEDDDSVHWLLAEDVGCMGAIDISDQFILGPEDNLHSYLHPMIRQMLGSSYHSLIMDGSRIIGSLRGKVKASGVNMQEMQGGEEAKAILTKHLRALGISIHDSPSEEEMTDWEIQSFYEKTHPGEV
ncbi:MAG: ATP-dependent helicase [Euryarchaeota archaeon]|nr:ATP-dependent helicase [Euryarchaeota archaeon]